MEYVMQISQTYIKIPIQAEQPEETLEIFCGEEKKYEFRVPVCKDAAKVKYDYCSCLDVTEFAGKELVLKGDFTEQFFRDIAQSDDSSQEPLVRPLLHFTAPRGWINDPNGLVCHNGQYHLYFQYNPMNTQWQNMSWGHAVSEDLLQFRPMDPVMYPDENGAMFSGCGLVNERGLLGLPKDALLFFYSAAGNMNKWSEGKSFTQNIAYSLDGGKTLVKMEEPAVGVIKYDTRDPKIFWHEETQAYIMVLWIEGNEFAVLRSADLKNWEQSDSFVLEKAWECPDLFCLECENEKDSDAAPEKIWVFTSADGFYYLGEFDGYRFTTDGVRRYAYQTSLPYAAQSYSNTGGRTIAVPWMRTKNPGRLYTGMMGLPRELKLVRRGESKVLSMLPVREYEESKKQIAQFGASMEKAGRFLVSVPKAAVAEVELRPQGNEHIHISVYGQELTIAGNAIFYKSERTAFEEPIREAHIIVDREIIEIHVNNGTGNVYYETGSDVLQGSVVIEGCRGEGKIYIWQP